MSEEAKTTMETSDAAPKSPDSSKEVRDKAVESAEEKKEDEKKVAIVGCLYKNTGAYFRNTVPASFDFRAITRVELECHKCHNVEIAFTDYELSADYKFVCGDCARK